MEYRILPHGGEKISIIGMGSSVIGERPEKDCIGCGHCDNRCPFHVRQSERMKMICASLGK